MGDNHCPLTAHALDALGKPDRFVMVRERPDPNAIHGAGGHLDPLDECVETVCFDPVCEDLCPCPV